MIPWYLAGSLGWYKIGLRKDTGYNFLQGTGTVTFLTKNILVNLNSGNINIIEWHGNMKISAKFHKAREINEDNRELGMHAQKTGDLYHIVVSMQSRC